VKRVIFNEHHRAIGVEYVNDIVARPGGEQVVSCAYASRLVVVSAGAFGSPAILERSGIGAPDILQKADIPVFIDLPSVGEGYMDHNFMSVPFLASEEADTLDEVFRVASESELQPYVTQWQETGKGLLAHNGIDAGIKIRPNTTDLKEIGPTFTKRWHEVFVNAPDKPVMWIGPLAAYIGANPAAARRKYFAMDYYSEYPASRGRVHITSDNPYGPLAFESGFLDEPEDLAVLRWAYKWSRELARRMDVYRGEFNLGHPLFPEGSAACANASSPVGILAPDIVYSEADNEAIDDYHRQTVETTWHSMGTYAMKPRDNNGVVDSRLNVYGVYNLKVADCSIAPENVGANTYNTALIIGEKAAVIIAEDLGIKGV